MAETVKKASSSKAPRATATTKAAKAKKATQTKSAASTASHEQIAQLAHRYWAERGHRHGSHEEDWYRAEQEIVSKAS